MCFPPPEDHEIGSVADKSAEILPGRQFRARIDDDRDPFAGGDIRDPVDGQAAVCDPRQVKDRSGLLVDGPLQAHRRMWRSCNRSP